MSFFNKKTDVIKVELTQYGKYLLSKGKFKPVYYEFFDNDVLYDGNYASISEERNDIQERIKNKTSYLKPQYNFFGLEKKLKRLNEIKKELETLAIHSEIKKPESLILQNIEEKLNINSYPLGTTILNNKVPIFKIISGDTQISSSVNYTDYNGYILHIPELKMKDSTYTYVAKSDSVDDISVELEKNLVSTIFPDGDSYFSIEEQAILLKINELNIKDLDKNFEIELFEVTSSKEKQIYLPLYFTNQTNSEDIKSAEYYFNITTDSEISSKDINKITSKVEQPSIMVKII